MFCVDIVYGGITVIKSMFVGIGLTRLIIDDNAILDDNSGDKNKKQH
jgi:hypothetical protein